MSGQTPETLDMISRSQEHWQATIDAVRDYIFVIGRDHIIRKANLAFAGRFGRHPKELIGLNLNELFPVGLPQPEELDGLSGEAGAALSREIVMDGSTFMVSVFPARYDELAVCVYVMKDISELIDLKNKLYHTYKLASLGRLVSGVAHELNNPLTGILGYTELIGFKMKDDSLKKDLGKIYQSAERCKVIIDSLLCFSRQQAPQKSLGYMQEIIDKTVDLRSYWHRSQSLEIVRQYEPDMPLAYLDTQQIQQVIMNLLLNAEQSIAESGRPGKIVITASHDRPNGRIVVSMTDNGIGIPRENQEKIFDPFYTTKPVNRGTGLGLSICYGIVLEHGGTIQVESREQEGATFRVGFPLK